MYGMFKEKGKAKKTKNIYHFSVYCRGRKQKVKKSLDKEFGKSPPDHIRTSNWNEL